jgi:hypothetical protein
LADREDSVHIRIKIDVDPQDKQFIENLSSEMARADDIRVKKEVTIKEEEPKKKKEKVAGADFGVPTFEQIETRYLKKFIKKLKEEIKGADSKDPKVILKKLQLEKVTLQQKKFMKGPVGIINRLSSQASANLIRLATNPSAFIVAGVTKLLSKYGKAAAKGGIYAVLAILIYETVLFVIDQFMQPGRALDRRFKRIARIETMNFYERQLQEELRHGYQEIRVTTMAGLRGGQSQVNGNLFEFSSGTTGILQSSPYRNSQEIYRSQNASGSVTDSQGNPRRRNVFNPGR